LIFAKNTEEASLALNSVNWVPDNKSELLDSSMMSIRESTTLPRMSPQRGFSNPSYFN